MYHMANETYACDFCGYEEDIEQRGSIWECEECGRHFCEGCFVLEVGRPELMKMTAGESDSRILCPECYKKADNICARCEHDEPGYVSVIGQCDHLCRRHWHCKPGGEHLDFKPKKGGAV